MSRKGTLEDEVARAEAGEARASRQAGLEPPSNHLVSGLLYHVTGVDIVF